MKSKIKKGDEVIVISGKDRGKVGKVIKSLPKERKVIVAGVNVVTKHAKSTKTTHSGIIYKEMPVHISNVAHVDPVVKVPTKVGFKFLEDGRKVRFAKKSGEIIDKL